MSKNGTLALPPLDMSNVPAWALAELQEDLQDAAVDLGVAYGAGDDPTAAEARYDLASNKLRRALALRDTVC